ncbi:MAG: sec-independent protein translocase protein TatB [Frankiaceae bacterium]|jgi:sec-independent protein translocase protein TatB|nr:sec-independent protein translocase protein TatB [Frankiaceae bacterium]
MFNNLGWPEIAVLALLGLLIFGPERLPKVAADAGRLIRELRKMARGVTTDIRSELGVDLDELRKLDPRRMFDDEPDLPEPPRRPVLATGEPPPYDPDAT